VIANDQQLAIVSRQLRELEAWRDQVLERKTLKPFQKRITVMGIERMIERLQEEVHEYESARSGVLPPVLTAEVQDDSFAEVASVLVRLRVAQGLRQEDVADAVGKQQPSIARWESEEYDGYTLKELNRLAKALGRQLRISFVAPGRAETAEQTST
jgi:hypothetical protein